MVTESYQDIHLEQPLTGFWQHLGNLLQRVGRIIIRWDQLARQRRQLREMDGRMLQDIGISAADVERIAGRRFWDTASHIDDRYRSSEKR